MTTIAYKAGVLAVDSQVTQGDILHSNVRKVLSDSRYVVAYCGDLSAGLLAAQVVLKEGFDMTKMLGYVGRFKDSSFQVIIWQREDETLWSMDERFQPLLLDKRRIWAFGSGRDIALGALWAGASPKEAVKIACRLDIYSGGRVYETRLK